MDYTVHGILQARILDWVAFPSGGPSGKEPSFSMQVARRNVGSVSGLGRSPGGGLETCSSILAWRIPLTEEPRKESA